MPPTLERKIAELRPESMDALTAFVDFLLDRQRQAAKDGPVEKEADHPRTSMFGALKGKVEISPDFDAPLEVFGEYM